VVHRQIRAESSTICFGHGKRGTNDVLFLFGTESSSRARIGQSRELAIGVSKTVNWALSAFHEILNHLGQAALATATLIALHSNQITIWCLSGAHVFRLRGV
jgi:hypothetical protein